MVGLHVEHLEHLVEHLAVLPRDADDRLELARPRLQLVHERAHLDRLRARPEDKHYLLHSYLPVIRLIRPRAITCATDLKVPQFTNTRIVKAADDT